MVHDPNFGGGMPEPKPKYLKELIEKVKVNKNLLAWPTMATATDLAR